jgi:DNA-binding transcriptional LysR family regulator
MNIHHLELFYYVAKHGGIGEAVRHFPYGIQQPAVSSQIIQLEEHLGVTLFHRRPFALTASGKELYAFIQPFFDNLGAVAKKLQGGTDHHILIGASEVVLREHMPTLLPLVGKQFPRLKCTLREGYQHEVEAWLDRREIDLGVTLLSGKLPVGVQAEPLLLLPLMLLVARESPIRIAEDLWKRDKIDEPLITLPSYESMCRNFQQGLGRKGIDWFPSIEVSSLNLIETYVANGYGIGLFLSIPKLKLDQQVRAIPLTDFAPVTVGALWHGKATPLIQAFIEVFLERAKLMLS